MQLYPGMSMYDEYTQFPAVAGPFIRTGAPSVNPHAPMVMPHAPMVMPQMPSYPPAGQKLGCSGCTRGISGASLSTGQKVALGALAVATAVGGFFAYRHFAS